MMLFGLVMFALGVVVGFIVAAVWLRDTIEEGKALLNRLKAIQYNTAAMRDDAAAKLEAMEKIEGRVLAEVVRKLSKVEHG
jgi:hypothetical protein